MGNQEASFTQLYQQALVNPSNLTPADFELLLARYPYSQPLYFALERRRFLEGQQSGTLGSQAVLLASSANWLYEYVQLPVDEVPLVEVEDDDYVPFEDVDMPTEDAEQEPVEQEPVPTDADVEKEEPVQTQEEPERTAEEEDTLETLVQQGVGGGDYFAVHANDLSSSAEKEEEESVLEETTEEWMPSRFEDKMNTAEPEEIREDKAAHKEEDISLYNDELMPYSFRWWVHKTRLEHADTYQPFASPRLPVANKRSFDPEELDRVILDQQIREHIIHLQSPEDKLSEEVKSREGLPANEPNKIAEVIERFIREEPQIQPPQPENLTAENKARKSSEEQFDLVTETLANIYAEQGMYVKAIEVYKKLILRFPEKKSYFATQIKELEGKLY